MIYVRPLSDAERAELKRMTRQEVGRVSQRAQMILLSAQHRRVPEIATLFEVSRATVRFWIRQFEAEGPAGLRDDPRPGRPRTVTPQVEERLVTLLQHDPPTVQGRTEHLYGRLWACSAKNEPGGLHAMPLTFPTRGVEVYHAPWQCPARRAVQPAPQCS
jgi:transposase-like protein